MAAGHRVGVHAMNRIAAVTAISVITAPREGTQEHEGYRGGGQLEEDRPGKTGPRLHDGICYDEGGKRNWRQQRESATSARASSRCPSRADPTAW